MYVDYSGHMPTWLTYTLGALAFVVAGVLVAATMGMMAPGVICATSFTLTFLGISLSTATTIATVGTMIVMTAAAAYAGDMAFTQVTGESLLLNTVFMGNETAYGIGAFATVIASEEFLYMFFKSLQMGICFVAGTLVETENGGIPIEEITAGMMVYAHNPDTGETELKEVVRVFRNEASELVHVYVNGEEIVCTNEHPFYSPVKGWTAACQLRAGDRLVTLNGEYVIVEQVQHEILEAPVAVYNFEVEGFHTYFVGETSVLVHNRCSVDDISTGRTTPNNLTEKLAMDSAKSNPSAGKVLNIKLKDTRLPEGSVKMSQIFDTSKGRIQIHYVWDKVKNMFFDFKFK